MKPFWLYFENGFKWVEGVYTRVVPSTQGHAPEARKAISDFVVGDQNETQVGDVEMLWYNDKTRYCGHVNSRLMHKQTQHVQTNRLSYLMGEGKAGQKAVLSSTSG